MAECGTYAGYQRHKLRNEVACQPCREANRDYLREWRNRPGNRAQGRAYGKAYNRAQADLIDVHRAEFNALLTKRLSEAGQS